MKKTKSKYKVFGDVKVGDTLYCIERMSYPEMRIVKKTVSKIIDHADFSYGLYNSEGGIVIKEKVPNTPEVEGRFSIPLTEKIKNASDVYEIFTEETLAVKWMVKECKERIADYQHNIKKANSEISKLAKIIKSLEK